MLVSWFIWVNISTTTVNRATQMITLTCSNTQWKYTIILNYYLFVVQEFIRVNCQEWLLEQMFIYFLVSCKTIITDMPSSFMVIFYIMNQLCLKHFSQYELSYFNQNVLPNIGNCLNMLRVLRILKSVSMTTPMMIE